MSGFGNISFYSTLDIRYGSYSGNIRKHKACMLNFIYVAIESYCIVSPDTNDNYFISLNSAASGQHGSYGVCSAICFD